MSLESPPSPPSVSTHVATAIAQPFDLERSRQRVRRVEVSAIAIVSVALIVVFPLLNAYGVVDNFTINLW